MAQPSIFPHASIAPGLSSSPAERERELAGLSPAPDWDRVLTELRTTIANGNFTLDAMLQHIVETAQMVTCANGAAIAIWQEDSVICQARAGNIAPDLGAKLDTDSGVSGQCLRTGGAFCCEDTNHDTRVDAEVCRRLGLRSLAVVPVGRKPAVSGVLEAFSVLPYAFRNAQVKLLEELAELVIVAQCRSAEATAQASSEKPVSATWKSWPELKLIIGAAVMLVVVLTSWLVFRREPGRPDLSMALTQPVTGPAALPPPAASPPAVLTPDRAPAAHATETESGVLPRVVAASKSEKIGPTDDVTVREFASENPSTPSTPAKARATITTAPLQNPGSASVTAPVVFPSSEFALRNLLPAPNIQPLAPIRLSQGLSGGTIERQVNPTYPTQALALRLEGSVVLRAVVTEDGTLRDLKVVKGVPLLARAAMEAVARWRYRPYRLNGILIRRPTEITVAFKLP